MPIHRVLVVVAAAAVLRAAAGGQVSGTLNFADETGRVIPTVVELPNNEKEVDVGDFDNDGDLDVVIASAFSDFGARRNKLYRNDGHQLIEATGPPVIPGFITLVTDVSRNAFFRDYDGDGWLDIIIVNDANAQGDAGRTRIYMSQHPGGVFSHFEEQGLDRLGPDTGGAACGAASRDFDGNGLDDLYVGNYPGPPQDTLYLNDGADPGYFIDVTATHVPEEIGAVGDYTVDVASADMNGDGTWDLLISNRFDFGGPANELYVNDLAGYGEGPGDFKYAQSVVSLGVAGDAENAMEPGDLDGDGMQDIYWSNRAPGGGDRVLRNIGPDVFGRPQFLTLIDALPASVTTVTSRKATVADLNADGRPDVVVMKESDGNSRPTVLRNTTVGGAISFVDWTPAPAFPAGQALKGWHAAVFDTGGDGDLDLLIGGWMGEHLIEQVPAPVLAEEDLAGGNLPEVHDLDPVAVLGRASPSEPDEFFAGGLAAGAFASVVLNGPDDYLLELVDPDGAVLARVDRGGRGVEEAVQLDPKAMPATLTIRVSVLDCAAPDLDGTCEVGMDDLEILIAAWGPARGHRADFDGDGIVGTADLLALLAGWGQRPYVLEVLARSN